MKKIAILGSTGSVGTSALDVIRRHPEKFQAVALGTASNVEVLASQIKEFNPKIAAIKETGKYKELISQATSMTSVICGAESAEELISSCDADIVLLAISGIEALKPLVAAIRSGKTIALASKEPIVSAGKIIMEMARAHSAKIIPVDSEHSAIMQCLSGRKMEEVESLCVTGSGGSLWGRAKEQRDNAGVSEVLAHPKWDMGSKITVDSATLMNKGLEIIEARWLFDMSPRKIEVVIHPEAVIHSMVSFVDGTVLASLFVPDMRFPIFRALSYPDIVKNELPRLNLHDLGNMTFEKIDIKDHPALSMAYNALKTGGTYPAALNGANEKAVKLFLDNKIRFGDILSCVEKVLDKHQVKKEPTLEDIIEAESWASEGVLANC